MGLYDAPEFFHHLAAVYVGSPPRYGCYGVDYLEGVSLQVELPGAFLPAVDLGVVVEDPHYRLLG